MSQSIRLPQQPKQVAVAPHRHPLAPTITTTQQHLSILVEDSFIVTVNIAPDPNQPGP